MVPPLFKIPVTAPVPVPVNELTVFCDQVWVPELDSNPTIVQAQLKLLTILEVTVAELLKLTAKPVSWLVPPVQLEKVFPVTVFIGEPPSVLLQPAMVVAPVTVIFEKLLLLFISEMVAPDVELEL